MRFLELLAPAKNIDIGIAAIDCGADAVYIAGPSFGARQAAGNSMLDIRVLCHHAHKYGARIFLTLNTICYDDELGEVYSLMQQAQDAGVDAIIVQDLALLTLARGGMDGCGEQIRIPLHASTQCAIRDVDKALMYKNLGFSRLVLERELPLETVRQISRATSCEIEFFVHGALCVCYSGQCYMSEQIAVRSANRGQCIQACRSLYDLVDESGKVLVRNKALLSLKDYNLLNRIGDLAEAGVTSFKIEGRLKNISYVKNTTRAYSQALDAFIAGHGDKYRRASHGIVQGGFEPDLNKTFNRGYTELHIDDRRGCWASLDTPKGMGEVIGKIKSISQTGKDTMEIVISPDRHFDKRTPLRNGDGFAFVGKDSSIIGFRGDICQGNTISCRRVSGMKPGMELYRNISTAFEKKLETKNCTRLIPVNVDINVVFNESEGFIISANAVSQDGRSAEVSFNAGNETASNQDRITEMLRSQIGKSTKQYTFNVSNIAHESCPLPFVSAAFLNEIRRSLAEQLDTIPAISTPLMNTRFYEQSFSLQDSGRLTSQPLAGKHPDYRYNCANHLSESVYAALGAVSADKAYEIAHPADAELMRTKYCIRYELGLCPKYQHAKPAGRLFLVNNGKRFALGFDCKNCEMTVKAEE